MVKMAATPRLFDEPPAEKSAGRSLSLLATFADVVFDRPAEHVYTYAVPDELVSILRPGMRIEAPFGRGDKADVGYCVNVHGVAPPRRATRSTRMMIAVTMARSTHRSGNASLGRPRLIGASGGGVLLMLVLKRAFDRGELELMTVTIYHESWKTLLTNLVNCYAEETGMVMNPAGNLTVRRKDLLKGLEPDDCFYVQNAAVVTPPRDLDFTVDPPPDLAIEVEKSRTVIKRLPIYAALGIPEVWRFNGKVIVVLIRQANGKYETESKSRAFPDLDLTAVTRHVLMLGDADQMTILRRFRAWVRKKYVR
jgi:Uma2 family endonuclease